MIRPALIVLFLFYVDADFAQDSWMLEIRSSVELRTLKLTNKAEQNSKPLRGATIALYQGNAIVKQATSDSRGDFSMLVPPDGDFMIVISYPGCNSKKFQVSTKGVPENYDKTGWEPAFPIGGVIMARPLHSIDYAALQQPMARIFFKQKGKVFDDDEAYTDEVLARLKKIKSDEDDLIARFLEAVQAGDNALKKPDCPLARMMYEKALTLIPGEEYPEAQLAKVGDCLKELQLKEQAKAEQEATEKQAEEARQRAREERLVREREEAARVAAEKQEAAAKKKSEEERLAAEKENARLEREKREQEERTRRAAEKQAREDEAAENERRAAEEKQARKKAEDAAKQKPVAESRQEDEKKSGGEESPVQVPKNQPVEPPTVPDPPKRANAAADREKNAAKRPEPVIAGSGGGDRSSRSVKSRRSRHTVRHVIGSSAYDETVSKADEHFRNREYEKARALYDKALDLKPLDAHATSRLDEIKSLLAGQSTH